MTIKIQKNALENDFDNGHNLSSSLIKQQVCILVKYKVKALSKGLIIPDDLIAEAEKFITRNRNKELNYQFCPRCLKAHMVKKADEFGLTKEEKRFVESKFIEEAGHQGYYMDEEKIVQI